MVLGASHIVAIMVLETNVLFVQYTTGTAPRPTTWVSTCSISHRAGLLLCVQILAGNTARRAKLTITFS